MIGSTRPSLLVRGATIIDGTGAAARVAGVPVEEGVITAVGAALAAPPRGAIVDGDGLVLAPGFIDLHTHCDFTIPAYPRADSMVRQGGTPLVTRHCRC